MIDKSEPVFVKCAARMKRIVKTGFKSVFLINRPIGSAVRPAEDVVSLRVRLLDERGLLFPTFSRQPAFVHGHDG